MNDEDYVDKLLSTIKINEEFSKFEETLKSLGYKLDNRTQLTYNPTLFAYDCVNENGEHMFCSEYTKGNHLGVRCYWVKTVSKETYFDLISFKIKPNQHMI